MAKYMPQDLFDTFALAVAFEKTATGKDYPELNTMRNYHIYESSYPGDNLFLEQVIDTASIILEGWKNDAQDVLAYRLQSLFELRKHLDEDLNKKSIKKRLLGGAVFSSSHPDPHNRVDQAIKNINIMAAIL